MDDELSEAELDMMLKKDLWKEKENEIWSEWMILFRDFENHNHYFYDRR